jgi:LacI family transcriptional regulator
MRHVTIKDIAKALNVSISTISRAFNDKYDIRKETRDMILETAKKMGYKPNPIAQKLISRRSFTIGVIVPEFVNSFFPEVIMGIQSVLIQQNYQVIIMSSNEHTETEKENLMTMEKAMVDGVIISLTRESRNIDYLRDMVDAGFPIVMFNRISEELNVPKVVFNDYKWAFFATEHLIENGCRKIVHFSGPQNLSFARNRIKGFTDAMKKHHLPITKENVLETGLFVEDGMFSMQKLVDSGNIPDAVFAVNDPTAIGAIKVLKKNELRVPGDVAVAGFSECSFAELIDPPLTSVVQPTFEMGRKVAELIIQKIEDKLPDGDQTYMLSGKLNIRASSLKNDALKTSIR